MVPLFNDYLMIINTDIDSPYQTYTLAAVKVFFLARRFLLSFFALFLQAGKHFGKTASSIRDTLVRNDRRRSLYHIHTHTHQEDLATVVWDI